MQRLHQVQKRMAMSYTRMWHWGSKWETEHPWHTQGEVARTFHVFGREKADWSKGKQSHGCFYTFLGCWRGSVDIFTELKRKENSSERGELDMLRIFMWNPSEASAWRVQGLCYISLKHRDVALDVKQIPKQRFKTERRG